MKRVQGLAGVFLAMAISASAQIVTDDFEDGAIDLTQWVPTEPYAGSDVTESGGVVRLTNRGTLTTVPDVETFVASARFRFASHHYDILEFNFRSDGDLDGRNGRPKNALVAYIRPTSNPDSVEVALVDESTKLALVRAATPMPILMNEYYVFTVEDDGSVVRILVDDQLVISHPVSADYGNHFHIGNRAELFNTPDLVTEIDWVDIEAPIQEVVDIKANGSDEVAVLASGEWLTLTADLVADPSVSGDTWILALTSQAFPFNLFSYNLDTGSWIPWLFSFNGPSAQGTIPELSGTILLQSNGLPDGFYSFYLGYDEQPNRRIDFGQLSIDAVSVIIGNK